MYRIIGALTLALLVSACAAAAPVVAVAISDLQNAVVAYQVAKGIAQVAVLANPALTPKVAEATAVLDPLQSTAQAVLSDAAPDAVAAEQLATQINAQVAVLTVTVAPAIKAVKADAK